MIGHESPKLGQGCPTKATAESHAFAVPSQLPKIEVMVTIGADSLRNCTGTSIRSFGRSVATALFWLFLRDYLDNLNSVVAFGSQEAQCRCCASKSQYE
jgi:hypothetical protein